VKLLRVLQERELERVGGTQTIRVDVRIIAATHRDLEAMVAAGDFREDLFYRLAVVPITIPPLRERADDAALLARHFVADSAKTAARPGIHVDDDAIALLAAQPWPGNVRQLQNFVERLVVLADSDQVRRSDVERELGRMAGVVTKPAAAAVAATAGKSAELALGAQRKETEREALLKALSHASNNRTRAARLLEVSRRTLYNKLKEHGLE
jgi:DNA-binding NtrC family response regulator